jgi:hypothetical protein
MQHCASLYRPEQHQEQPEILATTAREAAQYICDALIRMFHTLQEEGSPAADNFVYFAAALKTAIDHGQFGE